MKWKPIVSMRRWLLSLLVRPEELDVLLAEPRMVDPIGEVLDSVTPGQGREVPATDYESLVALASSTERVLGELFWQDALDQLWWARERVIDEVKAGEVSIEEAAGAIKALDACMRLPHAVISRLEHAQNERGIATRNAEWVKKTGLRRKER